MLWALMLMSGAAHGVPGETSIYDERGKLLRGSESISWLGPDLFGDQAKLYAGSLEFVQTDISLPGNSALPVDISRRFTVGANGMRNSHFGDWNLEFLRAHGVLPVRARGLAGMPTARRLSRLRAHNGRTRPILSRRCVA